MIGTDIFLGLRLWPWRCEWYLFSQDETCRIIKLIWPEKSQRFLFASVYYAVITYQT